MASFPLLETTSAAAASCSRPSLPILKPKAPSLRIKTKGLGTCDLNSLSLGSRRQRLFPFRNASSIISCTINMTEGESSGPRRLDLDHLTGEIKKNWERLPQPVKSFPWPEALENFLELILSLVVEVAKYLSGPILVLTTLSELSYCAYERKMRLVPIPLLAGFVMAWILRDTTLELYPHLKEGEFPWHLVAVASIFVLLKLPGPYYPYWGRIFIPHFANGGLLMSLWLSLVWYKKFSSVAAVFKKWLLGEQ